MGDDARGRAAVADQTREAPRVESRHADEAVRPEPVIERLGRAPARGLGDIGGEDQAAGRRGDRLQIVAIGADIADMGKGESDDLAGITGIGEDLLIAGHGGVEADLAHGRTRGADAAALQHGAVGQHQNAGRNGTAPADHLSSGRGAGFAHRRGGLKGW
jgi:hypothetical protein